VIGTPATGVGTEQPGIGGIGTLPPFSSFLEMINDMPRVRTLANDLLQAYSQRIVELRMNADHANRNRSLRRRLDYYPIPLAEVHSNRCQIMIPLRMRISGSIKNNLYCAKTISVGLASFAGAI
jgi:hypothetical protein